MIVSFVFSFAVGVFLAMLYDMVLFWCVKKAKTKAQFKLLFILRFIVLGIVLALMFRHMDFRQTITLVAGFTVARFFVVSYLKRRFPPHGKKEKKKRERKK